MNLTPEQEARFWAKVDKSGGPDACWPWLASCTLAGYGQFGLAYGHMLRAHRVMWELTHGPIPNGLYVCHNCPGSDNRRCVNPATCS